uniref:mRNA capping enzyme adenylation domain-containing protein n=1 Tax=viral metagenome TaxID=1070528 RepID=A0A6C0IFN5_9ZZZZ
MTSINDKEQEQVTQGVLQSSYRNTHAVNLKKASPAIQQTTIEYLNNHCQDLVIAQRLTPDKAEKPLKNGSFFLTNYIGKAEPGFLVFLPKQYPTFVRFHLSKREREHTKGQPLVYIMRMRTSNVVNEGSVFVAALDVNSHLMILEDVYIWRNQNIFQTDSFSKRRLIMKEFVEKHWIPDSRLLGGIVTEVSQPKPLASFKTLIENKESHRVDFVPEMAGRRRFYMLVNETKGALSTSDGYYGRVVNPQPVVIPQPVVEARAVKVPLLPDVYELFDNNNKSLGNAAIQQLELSKKLKEIKDTIWVTISYNEDFKRYEITGLKI